MILLRILICQGLIISVCLALPSSNDNQKNKRDNKTEMTTVKPIQGKETKKAAAEAIKNKIQKLKPSAKKRDISGSSQYTPGDLNRDEEGIVPAEEFERSVGSDENQIPDELRSGEVFVESAAEYPMYEGEERRKRTAILEELLSAPGSRPKRELELTPDNVLALLSLWEEQQRYRDSIRNQWVERERLSDLPDEVTNLGYDEDLNAINTFDENDLDGEEQNLETNFPRYYKGQFDKQFSAFRPKYAWGKRFMVSRKRRSFFPEPLLKIPVYRRAVLK